jgi:transcriptional regulator with XRE-family HTH domain
MRLRPRYKEWLARRGKTNKDLAEHLRISEGRVSEWVNNKGYPRFEMLWETAKFLEIKMDDLYEEIKEGR